jgi:hypothetical protein
MPTKTVDPLRKLAYLVATMRMAQRDYFRYRTQAALTCSKSLEAEVDQRCKQILTNEQVNPLPFEHDRRTD